MWPSAILLSILTITTFSDNNSDQIRICTSSEYMELVSSKNATWTNSLHDANTEWLVYSKSNAKTARLSYPNIEIPVIWHVLKPSWTQQSEQINDEVIAYLIGVLNQDFNGLNENYDSGTPQEFKPVRCGSSGIRFKINSVIKKTKVGAFRSLFDINIKRTPLGGSDPIRSWLNLNIWTVNIGNPELDGVKDAGFATFPAAPLDLDGVVLNSAIVDHYNQGSILTHHVGHWFGLEHIWGENVSECINVESISDYVLDTPAHRGPNEGCPVGKKSCSDDDIDTNPYSQDMYMNFMDFTDGECKSMFTLGQCDRMWFMIRRFRKSLLRYTIDFRRDVSDIPYVSWLYFRKFEFVEHIEDNVCFEDDHILFYSNDLNTETSSNISIFGCLVKTQNMRISHIIDVSIIYENGGCNDGYTQSSQDLNEGNNGSSIYLCYLKEESIEDNENMAVLDITFIASGGMNKLDMNEGWKVDSTNNLSPNGINLYLALRTGPYYTVTDKNDGLSYRKLSILLSTILFSVAVIFCVVIYISIKHKKKEEEQISIIIANK